MSDRHYALFRQSLFGGYSHGDEQILVADVEKDSRFRGLPFNETVAEQANGEPLQSSFISKSAQSTKTFLRIKIEARVGVKAPRKRLQN